MEYYVNATRELCEELELLQHNEADALCRANKAANLIKKTLTSFRNCLRKEDFNSLDDEIYFFKYTKPQILAYFFHYSILAELEHKKIMLTDEEVKAFIDSKHRMYRHILRDHIEFVRYYHEGLTHFDNLYFLRGANNYGFSRLSNGLILDPEFNTSHDVVAANIIAFDLFQKHFTPKPELQPSFGPPPPKLKWTANRLDLVELIYALQASGAINYGDADLKDLAKVFETMFQIQIGDLYRSFHDISNRKKDQIKFVNRLEGDLERKILELEGFN